MDDKKTRYIRTILPVDRPLDIIGITIWNEDNFNSFLFEEEKKYGLKLISSKEELLIIVEYQNIIWNYKIYYGYYKRNYKHLINEEKLWLELQKQVVSDLKIIGLEEIKEQVFESLLNNKYFKYQIKIDQQFKKYCV